MAKICPVTNEPVLYLDCLECDDKVCENAKKENNSDMNVKSIVSRICNSCSSDCFNCPRKNWHPDKIPTGLSPSRTDCPMMQFEAEEDTDKRPWYERLRDGTLPDEIEVTDTFSVCANCKYAKVTGSVVSIAENLHNICFMCPNFQVRDSLTECEDEAACS